MKWSKTTEIDIPTGVGIALDTGVIYSTDPCEICGGKTEHVDVYSSFAEQRIGGMVHARHASTRIVIGPCGHRVKHFTLRATENQFVSMMAALWAIDEPVEDEAWLYT